MTTVSFIYADRAGKVAVVRDAPDKAYIQAGGEKLPIGDRPDRISSENWLSGLDALTKTFKPSFLKVTLSPGTLMKIGGKESDAELEKMFQDHKSSEKDKAERAIEEILDDGLEEFQRRIEDVRILNARANDPIYDVLLVAQKSLTNDDELRECRDRLKKGPVPKPSDVDAWLKSVFSSPVTNKDASKTDPLKAVISSAKFNDLIKQIEDQMNKEDFKALYEVFKYQAFDREAVLNTAIASLGPKGTVQLAFLVALRGTSAKQINAIEVECDGTTKGKVKVGSLVQNKILHVDPRGNSGALSAGRVAACIAPETAEMLHLANVPARSTSSGCPAFLQFPGALAVDMDLDNFKKFVTWLREFQKLSMIPSNIEAEKQAVQTARTYSRMENLIGKSSASDRIAYLIQNPNTYVKPVITKKSVSERLADKILAQFDVP